jgi:DNA invertase Pin-like site-specific DNA recombinase
MRVSTRNHGQTTDTQAVALHEYAERRGFHVVEYRDEGVRGAKDRRPAPDKLMKDARARRFDVVIVARFDRFARSVSHLLRALEEFNHLRIHFVSLSEAVDTATLMGRMIFTVLGAVAELGRNLIQERIHRRLQRARKQGKQLGRRRIIVDREMVRELYKAGNSVRTIAAEMGLTKSTVHSIVAERK